MNCKNCKSKRLKKPNYKLKKYSLDLYECEKCRLVQFSKLPPLEEMYGETYGYRTSLSQLMINHMNNKFKKIHLGSGRSPY